MIQSKKYYNKLIKINKKIKHEKLFRKDINRLLIPIKYNFKTKKNKGSAYFYILTKIINQRWMYCFKRKRFFNYD